MQADEEAKSTRGHVAGAHEEALAPAGAGIDHDAIVNEPARVEEKGQRLLAVGEDEVVDEKDKLGSRLAFPNPRGYPPRQEEEK